MLDRDDTAPIQMTPACNARWLRSANSTASKARTATSNSRLVWRTAAGLWLAVAGISAGLLAEPSWAQEKSPLAAAPDTSVPAELIIGAERLSQVFRATAKQLKPSVVTITSSVEVKVRGRNRAGAIGELELPPGFENFLPPEMLEQLRPNRGNRRADETESRDVPIEKMQSGMGSGIIVTPDGVILTNNHVIADADELQIELSDGRLFSAALVGSDDASDVAVLKIDATGLTPARLGNSAAMEVGDWVLAIGSPFGLDQTVTAGIVSATNRQTGIIPGGYEDFLQTDAAINPGNSGGPLVSLRGEVIGINTAINSRSGTNSGVGFAIPINMAQRIMEDLLRDGRVVRGWLGASLDDVNMRNAAELKLPPGVVRGAVIATVKAGEPAANAGLRSGDVVVAINDAPVASFAQLRNRVALSRPGSQLVFDIYRNGQKQRVDVLIGELSSEKLAAMVERTEIPALGMVVQQLTAPMAEELGADSATGGVVVTEIKPGSRAMQLRIRPGDIITSVDDTEIGGPADLSKALDDPDDFTMQIQRGNRVLQLQATSR
ncbi:MAG: Do family serine endopeptidase [Pirellulaceae bacterium]